MVREPSCGVSEDASEWKPAALEVQKSRRVKRDPILKVNGINGGRTCYHSKGAFPLQKNSERVFLLTITSLPPTTTPAFLINSSAV
jgi:hypothetical protein